MYPKPLSARTCSLMLAGCLLASGTAAMAERISWLSPELTPSEVAALRGSGRKGLADPLAAYLSAQWGMPGVQHETVMANPKRSIKMLEAGETACHLAMLHTPERESKFLFFDTHLVPPMQLVLRRELLDQVPRNAAGEADLGRLLQEGRLRGALIDGRSYGKLVDDLLREGTYKRLSYYTISDFGGRLIQMLGLGRADYSIEYDASLQVELDQNPALAAQVRSLPIQGASNPLLSSVACPRNDWGRRTLDRVAKLLATPAGVAAIKASFYDRLTPETRQLYGARIEAFYAELAKGGAR